MNKSIYSIITIISLLLPFSAFSQRLIANVSVDLEHLPQENQNKLQGIGRVVEAYINQEDWAPNKYDYDVNVDIEIYFDAVKAISFEDRYSGSILISNRSNAQFNDKRWDFPLEPGVQLRYTQQFDPFRSTIDFYIQMILGYEFDKVKKFGGNQYFETAKQIAQNARFNSRYFNGWDKREKLVEDQMLPENDYYRYLNFLYYTGEWLYYVERDRVTAKQYLLYAIKQLDRVPRNDLERFFDLNHYNFANALADYKEYSSLSKLASLDSEHADVYQKLLRKQ